MGRYIVHRLILLVPTLLGISVLVFVLLRLLPGNVVDVFVGHEAVVSQAQRQALYHRFGLDAPISVQYLRWLAGIGHGDLGLSLRTGQPVMRDILDRLAVTAELTVLSACLAWLIAIPLGVLAAVRRSGGVDLAAHMIALIGLTVPSFWLATLLLLVTSVYLRWQPSPIWVSPFESPGTNAQQMILPVLSLSAALTAGVMRMMRSSLLDVLGAEYVRTARAKGLAGAAILARHALRNAAIPVITVQGIQVGYLLGGAVVIEQVYGLPGLGWEILNGIYQRDYPLVQAGVLCVAVGFVLVNLLVDVVYAYVDPRIRYDG